MNEQNKLCCEELDPINIGYVKTPNPGSYFCTDHSNCEPVLFFDVNSVKTKYSTSSIKSTFIQDKFKITKIHDVYCEKINSDDGKDDDEDEDNINILYLVGTS